MAIFSDLIENIMEVFMDDFLVYGRVLMNALRTWMKFSRDIKTRTWSLIGKSAISWSERGLSLDIECPKEG